MMTVITASHRPKILLSPRIKHPPNYYLAALSDCGASQTAFFHPFFPLFEPNQTAATPIFVFTPHHRVSGLKLSAAAYFVFSSQLFSASSFKLVW